MQHSKASAPAAEKRTSPASFRAKQAKHIKMLTVIYLLSGLLCFWLFYKAVDLFEKI